jgi:hypothetical protein
LEAFEAFEALEAFEASADLNGLKHEPRFEAARPMALRLDRPR